MNVSDGLIVDYCGINMLIEEGYTAGFSREVTTSINRAIEEMSAQGERACLIILSGDHVRAQSARIKLDESGKKVPRMSIDRKLLAGPVEYELF